jgi:iron(III) transport system ATP-binding protein
MTQLSIKGLTKEFGGVPAVVGIDLEIDSGELVVLLGPSGCGKTTTLRCIAGFEDVSDGLILMDGTVVSSPTTSVAPEHRSIGMVFQSYAVWPHMNVFENVAYGVRLKRGMSRAEADRRTMNALDTVGLGAYRQRSASELSGGQQQRVALARAIALEPKALLFDEPLSNLDAKLRKQMRLEIRELQRRLGITAVYVTHDQEEAMVIADRIVLMKEGRIEQIGTPKEIYGRPASVFAAEFIGSANVLAGTVKEIAHGLAAIELAPGVRIHSAMLTAAPGTRIDAIFRPEQVRVSVDAPDAQSLSEPCGSLRGCVTQNVFVGGFSEVSVDAGGVTIRAQVTPAQFFTVGTNVWLSVVPEQVVTLCAHQQTPAVTPMTTTSDATAFSRRERA